MNKLIFLIPFFLIGAYTIQESSASCEANFDWRVPCFDQGYYPDKKELKEIWGGYYEHKGSAFMEWKKIEMFRAIENDKFEDWLSDKNNPRVHHNVYNYYLSIDEVTSQLSVKGEYMGNIGSIEPENIELEIQKLRILLTDKRLSSESKIEVHKRLTQLHSQLSVKPTHESFADVQNNTDYSLEKFIITMTQDPRYRFGCDSRIPSYDERPNCFSPAIAYVDVNQLVVFKNTSLSNVMIVSGTPQDSPDGLFESELMRQGSSYEISFDKTGIVNYFNVISPEKSGTIIVGDSTINLPPIIHTNQNQVLLEGTIVKLSMTGEDPENGELRYNWKQVSGPLLKSSISNFPKPILDYYPLFVETSKTVSFTAPDVYTITTLVFEATVIDNTLQRTTDTVQITIVNDYNSENYPTVTIKEKEIPVSIISYW